MADTLGELKKQIKNTNDLHSVVRTMKAMSAARIAPFEEAVTSLKDYHRTIALALSVCLRSMEMPGTETRDSSKLPTGYLIFGTDQGMVGQFNEILTDEVIHRIKDLSTPTVIWAVGERVELRLANAGLEVAKSFTTPSSVAIITPLVADILIELQRSHNQGEVGSVFQVHNHPVVRGSYETYYTQLYPLDQYWFKRIAATDWPTHILPEIIGSASDNMGTLIREYLFASVFQACAESCAAENAARLVAMQLAEKNIEERRQRLDLDYNHKRQSTIDEELFDLIAGFESLS